MRKLKYVKLFENFGKLNESVDDNWVVNPYEFKTPEDWQEEFNPTGYRNGIELSSTKRPPQNEVDEFESYIDSQVEASSSYGSESTFKNIIENLLTRSFEEMFKVKEPILGPYFWGDNFFRDMYEQDWHKNKKKIEEVVKYFMDYFSSDSKFEKDDDAYRGGYESSESGSYEGSVDFKGTEVFSWSSGGDGYNFSGSMDNVEMLYKEIKDYLTMVLYI